MKMMMHVMGTIIFKAGHCNCEDMSKLEMKPMKGMKIKVK